MIIVAALFELNERAVRRRTLPESSLPNNRPVGRLWTEVRECAVVRLHRLRVPLFVCLCASSDVLIECGNLIRSLSLSPAFSLLSFVVKETIAEIKHRSIAAGERKNRKNLDLFW